MQNYWITALIAFAFMHVAPESPAQTPSPIGISNGDVQGCTPSAFMRHLEVLF